MGARGIHSSERLRFRFLFVKRLFVKRLFDERQFFDEQAAELHADGNAERRTRAYSTNLQHDADGFAHDRYHDVG
jgi:hypothetical protein